MKTGRIIRWYGTSTDIEALKQTEERLTETSENFAGSSTLFRKPSSSRIQMVLRSTQIARRSTTPGWPWKMLRHRAFASGSSTRTISSDSQNSESRRSPGAFPFNSSSVLWGKRASIDVFRFCARIW